MAEAPQSISIRFGTCDYLSFILSVRAADTHPTAYVLQSHAGAMAVIGSMIVRADMCSEFCGWNRIMLPSAFPAACKSVPETFPIDRFCPTKGDVPIPHPCCSTNRMV